MKKRTNSKNRWNRKILGLGIALVVMLGLVVLYQARSVRAGTLDLLDGNGDFETTTKYNFWVKTNPGTWTMDQNTSTAERTGAGSARMTRATAGTTARICNYSYDFTTPAMVYGVTTLNPVLTGKFWKTLSSTTYITAFDLDYELVRVADNTMVYTSAIDSSKTASANGSFSFNLDNLDANTQYELRLIATAQGSSSSYTRTYTVWWDDVKVTYTDDAPTTNNITSPASGTNQKGIIQLNANAVDDLKIDHVDFQYADNPSFTGATNLSGAVISSGSNTNGTWSLNWDTSSLNGTYYVRAIAYDIASPAVGGPNAKISSTCTYYIDNLAPTAATVAEPPDSTTRRGTITLTANAQDNTGVTSVNFEYADNPAFTGATTVTGVTRTAGTATNGTWTKSFDTNSLTDGTWYFRATATDGWANSYTGGYNLAVVDNTNPSAVSVTLPSDGSQVTGIINLTANAQDNLHADKVYFEYDDNTGFSSPGVLAGATLTSGTVTSGTWQYTGFDTTGLPDGSQYVRAKVYDEAGNYLIGNYVTVTTHNVPPTTATLTAPSNNSTISGTYSFTANAADTIGVDSVDFQYSTVSDDTSGTLLSGATLTGGNAQSGTWTKSVDTTTIPDGTYYFRVKATDTAGNVLFGPESLVEVDNYPPTFTVQYFKDESLSQSLDTFGGKPVTTASKVYIKVISSEALTAAPTLNITAPGTANDRTGVTAPLTGGSYVYVWNVAADADGDAFIAVTGTNLHGRTATDATPVSGVVVGIDTTAAAPTLTGNKGVSRTFLNWSTLPDAKRYYVYRSTQDGFTPDDGTNKIGEVLAPASAYTDIVGEGTYYYRIKVSDIAGNMSDYSGQVVASSLPETVNMVTYWDDQGGGSTVYWAADVTASGAELAWQAGTVYAPGTANAYTVVPNTQMYQNYYFKVVKSGVTTIIKGFPTSNSPGQGGAINTAYGHGNFGQNTSLCAACHVTHAGLKENLLRESTYYDLCLFCHGTASTQSKYDVQSGKVLTVDGWKNSLGGPIGSDYGTSRHNVDDRGDVVTTVYGSAPGKTLTFTCLSCHKPHAGTNDNYRLLREVLYPSDDKFTSATVNFTAYSVVKNQTVGEEVYLVSGSSEFCAACHEDYVKGSAQEAGGTYRNFFRHPVSVNNRVYSVYNVSQGLNLYPQGTEKLPLQSYLPGDSPGTDKRTAVVCLTCHYAHGSYKEFNEGYPMPNGQPRLWLQNEKMLREPNYGVCESCHQK